MGLGPRLMGQGGGARKPEKGPAPPIKIENRIGIQASSEVIWELLSDLSSWGRWSQVYAKAEGVLRIGAPLSLSETLPGMAARAVSARVVDWVPYEQILWSEAPWRGWVKVIHYIEVDELDKTACIITTGEQIGGFVGDLYAERRRIALKRGFLAFNEALKGAAEALWEDRR